MSALKRRAAALLELAVHAASRANALNDLRKLAKEADDRMVALGLKPWHPPVRRKGRKTKTETRDTIPEKDAIPAVTDPMKEAVKVEVMPDGGLVGWTRKGLETPVPS